MTLSALIVDDEKLARDRLASLLVELGQVEIVGEARNAQDALIQIQEREPNIVFLDIRMPGMTGLDLAQHLATLRAPPAVIFTTAHDEYAMSAFETEAAGYLLKPVRKTQLAAATERAARLTRHHQNLFVAAAPRTTIAIRQREGISLLRVDDVICLIAEQKYTIVRHAQGEDLIEDSLRQLEAEFPNRFLRIHRNALVNRDWVEAIERHTEGHCRLRLRQTEYTLAVSRRLVAELKQKLELT